MRGFRFDVEKYTEDIVNDFVSTAEDLLYEWEYSLKDALSVDLPLSMRGRLTQPRDRLFPYMHHKDLRDSVYTDVDVHRSISGKSKIIHIEAGIESLHGLNGREDAGWLDWKEDVLHGINGRGHVPSLRNIADKIYSSRRSHWR